MRHLTQEEKALRKMDRARVRRAANVARFMALVRRIQDAGKDTDKADLLWACQLNDAALDAYIAGLPTLELEA